MTGGILANSIAIFTDCAHLASDMLSFLMAMYALKVSLRPASQELTFGWHRAEIIGTLASMMFLITITLWLLVAAVGRIVTPQPVDGLKMLITAIVSLGFNLVQIKILHQGDIHYHPGGAIGGGGHDHSHGEGEEHTHDDTEAGEEKKEGAEHTHDHSHSHE
jgi:zinc transporter 2